MTAVVWTLVARAGETESRTEVPIDTAIPLDVDTWDDYGRLLDSVAR